MPFSRESLTGQTIPKPWELIASYQSSTTVQVPIICRQTTSFGVKFNDLEAEGYFHISDVGNTIHSHVLVLLLFADSLIPTSINPHSRSLAILKSVRSGGAVLPILAVAVTSSSALMVTVSVASVCVGGRDQSLRQCAETGVMEYRPEGSSVETRNRDPGKHRI